MFNARVNRLRPLRIERLEERRTFDISGGDGLATISYVNGALWVQSGPYDDEITFFMNMDGEFEVLDRQPRNPAGFQINWYGIKDIRFFNTLVIQTGAGNDEVDLSALNRPGLPQLGFDSHPVFDVQYYSITVSLGEGDDEFFGSSFGEHVFGDGGDDVIYGLKGFDNLVGGEGNDVLEGGEGNDSLSGGAGVDTMRGGVGSDWIYTGGITDAAQDGLDQVFGGEGKDYLFGNISNNSNLKGENGDDLIASFIADDVIDGGFGDDSISALWSPFNRMFGGSAGHRSGNDIINGINDEDSVAGEHPFIRYLHGEEYLDKKQKPRLALEVKPHNARDNGTVVSVAFFLDKNLDGVVDYGDTYLGMDSTPEDGFTADTNLTRAMDGRVVFAQPYDDDGFIGQSGQYTIDLGKLGINAHAPVVNQIAGIPTFTLWNDGNEMQTVEAGENTDGSWTATFADMPDLGVYTVTASVAVDPYNPHVVDLPVTLTRLPTSDSFGGGALDDPTLWSGGVVPTGATASLFAPDATAQTATLGSAAHFSSLIFNSVGGYQLSGTGSLTLSDEQASSIYIASGNVSISTPVNFATSSVIDANAAALTLVGGIAFADNVTVSLNSGVLNLSLASGSSVSVGENVTFIISEEATLNVSGVDALSDPLLLNRVHIVNGGHVNFVGGTFAPLDITGDGTTVVFAGVSVSLDSIAQDVLRINGTAADPNAVVALRPSGTTLAGDDSLGSHLGLLDLASDGASLTNGVPVDGYQQSVRAYYATFDIGNNDLTIDRAAAIDSALGDFGFQAEIEDMVRGGYNLGVWGGRGMHSFSAYTDPSQYTGIGALLNFRSFNEDGTPTAPFVTYFAGQRTDSDSMQMLVKFTYYGDSNFDGLTDFVDYGFIDAGIGGGGFGWLYGDYNLDGIINFVDYGFIDAGFTGSSLYGQL